MAKETDITRAAIKAIKALPVPVRVMKIVAGDGQEAGISDVLCCVNGRFVAIEMKKPDYKHKVSALQALYLDDVERAGGYAAVCASADEAKRCVLLAADGCRSAWRLEADERAFPKRNREFPVID